jgi:hypothetical protein
LKCSMFIEAGFLKSIDFMSDPKRVGEMERFRHHIIIMQANGSLPTIDCLLPLVLLFTLACLFKTQTRDVTTGLIVFVFVITPAQRKQTYPAPLCV